MPELAEESRNPFRDLRFEAGQRVLSLCFTRGGREKRVVFHDSIRKGGKRYFLFHTKTEIAMHGQDAVVRTPAIAEEDGAPIRGLIVTYRFHFVPEQAAFYVSASCGSDAVLGNCAASLLDVTWENMVFDSYAGYERDAEGKPFSRAYPMPEENPDTPDYDMLQLVKIHVLLEKWKTRPHAFREALSLSGPEDYLAVIGGTPTFQVEARYFSVFPSLASYDGDLRFYSGKNSPGAWFLLEEPEDFFAAISALEQSRPSLPLQVLLTACEREILLQAGDLSAKLLQTAGGLWTAPVEGADDGEDAQPAPLFYLKLWDTEYERELVLDSGSGWDRIDVTQRKDYCRLILSDPENGRVTQISVILEAFLSAPDSRIAWKTRVINRSGRWSVSSVSYPVCLSRGFSSALVSRGCGAVLPEFARHTSVYVGKYPTGVAAPMGFCALCTPGSGQAYPNGLYIGVHDADGSEKSFTMAGAPQSGCVLTRVEYPASWLRRAGNTTTLPGEMVWQRFRGDWFDAVGLYRSFVRTASSWFPKLRGRPDSPQWIREMPVWVMSFLPNENPDAAPLPTTLKELSADPDPDAWYRQAIRMREALGIPIAYHVYNWHWVPFNYDNPHYFPAHAGFKEGVRAMREAGIRIVPYIAGYSWDMNDDRGADYRFQKEALPATAKDINGNTIFTYYATKKPNGSRVQFARICPSTALWKNELRQIVRKLYTDYSVDGIYLDVVSLGYDHCCDESHLHAPGHGHFWGDAYRELIASLRVDAPEDFALTSESVSEVYASDLDAYLSWYWIQPEGVPAFPQVYGGHVSFFGRVITWNKRKDAAYFRFHIAQSLVWGQQLGWIHPELVDDPEQFPFLKKMALLRWRHREFFTEAEMLRPPEITGGMELLDSESMLRLPLMTHEKCVVAGGWEDAAGQRLLFIINSGKQPAEIELTVRADEYRLPDSVTLTEEDGCALRSQTDEHGKTVFALHLDGEGYGVIGWNSAY